jgi:hypothetical protein
MEVFFFTIQYNQGHFAMSCIVEMLLSWNLVSNDNVTGPTEHLRPQNISLQITNIVTRCSVNYRYVKGLSMTGHHVITYAK